MGPTALLPFRRKSYSGFLRTEKNPSTLAGIEPTNLGEASMITTGSLRSTKNTVSYGPEVEDNGSGFTPNELKSIVKVNVL